MADKPPGIFQELAQEQTVEENPELAETAPTEGDSGAQKASATARRFPRLLFSRQWWWTTLLVIAGMILLARLGIWQLDRLDQRRTQNALLLQQMNAPPINLGGMQLPSEFGELVDRLATASGEFDYSSQIVLTQQSLQGRPGVHLITPLKIEGTNFAVLVDRGWVPAREATNGNLSRYNEEQFVNLKGVITASEEVPSKKSGSSSKKTEWYRIDITELDQQIPYELLPIYLEWLPDELDLDPPIRTERDVDLSEGSHLSYAFQWFIFTLLLGGGYIAFIARQEKR